MVRRSRPSPEWLLQLTTATGIRCCELRRVTRTKHRDENAGRGLLLGEPQNQIRELSDRAMLDRKRRPRTLRSNRSCCRAISRSRLGNPPRITREGTDDGAQVQV